MKRLILVKLFAVSTLLIHAQLSLKELTGINLGESYKSANNKIPKFFKTKGEFYKSDLLNAHRIVYSKVPFHNYGNADYTFIFIKDSLVAVKIYINFTANEVGKFEIIAKSMFEDFNESNGLQSIKQYSNINLKSTIEYVRKECIRNSPLNNANYKPIKEKDFNESVWKITKSFASNKLNNQYPVDNLDERYLLMQIYLTEIHGSVLPNDPTSKSYQYDGGWLHIMLTLTNPKFENLFRKDFEIEGYYKLINSLATEIKLNFEDGIYKVPVKLNDKLEMDFVLDLGAADVSISPDVFLVLYKTGTIKETDFIGTQNYRLADGTTVKSNLFLLKSLEIGNQKIENVRTAISNSTSSPLLLGQSALKKLGSYRIDNVRSVLIIE
jgi:hypothetical protein